MDGGISCIQCGYPLRHTSDGGRLPDGACPECGTSVALSLEWGALGGETAALERLIRVASLVASLAIARAALEALRRLLRGIAPPVDDVGRALHWSVGIVALCIGVGAWCAWRSTERRPPFVSRSRIPVISKVLLGSWWVAAATVIVWSAAPNVFSGGSMTLFVLSLLAWFVFLPASTPLAALAQSAGSAPPHWRRRQRPTWLIAWIMLGLIVAYVLGLVLLTIGVGTVTTAEAHERWSNIMLLMIQGRSALMSTVMPMALLALAAAQLLLMHQAAATVRRPATLAALRRVLFRRVWVGAILLTAVLFVSVAYVHAFIYGFGGTSRLAVTNDHATLIFAGALGATAVLWFVAALAPLLVVRRAIERAMKP